MDEEAWKQWQIDFAARAAAREKREKELDEVYRKEEEIINSQLEMNRLTSGIINSDYQAI